ncbi:MAG TPA: SUMF1/EgtB/PvdO family nonheme iron enzyme [Saprospiraceae bacterium]|nr:SUMF1/EgtB/PvdO family nonheme iron enzyme [Saprospiraceae bacterium]MCC6688481.1 SUMF1/EgtB/PvdO family nonheme iron enzyme [Saprospiraceae bacterium]HMW74349.1 SUMF1/EgtB/PvdO family nonheme iron enzyme [Saprospiraceae bacterium]HMX82276.1 SUMF1/EgtB/PvdO family nonheme iron enzyme [Saprospiraceae bacterium]HMX85733.1 SUMF1/EgtB/PvdO family nonheme iron enzyme [Saprospiraceae bacterium]
MKKHLRLLPFLTLLLILSSCGRKENGQLIGVLDRPTWKNINPYGMVYIPSGTFTLGQSDEDVRRTYMQRQKAVSIQGFYMDDTEITNNEYRQFVNWVSDSIAHTMMDHMTEDDQGNQTIDWEQQLDWTDETLNDLYYQGDDKFAGKKEINTSKLVYAYEWYDWQAAAHDHGKSPRNKFIKREKIKIYPDTMVWIRDFAYSYNEPFTRNYFWHPAFDDYPVVGVNWHMANAFCYWRTKLWNSYRASKKGEVNSEDFRLPTEYEWEYAARGGRAEAPYPWGAYYTRNAKGCLLANFKPGRGNYPEDGGLYTVKADAYFPNDYGLRNMAGNVAEWTITAFSENGQSFIHDLNPDIRYDAKADDPIANKRKVIRGGSWKDVAHFIQTSTRHYEFQDTTKSYIGFRCALTFLGRSINDF